MKNTLYIVLAVLLILLVRNWEGRDIVHEPGVLVPETPRQLKLAAPEPIRIDDFVLTPRAEFRIRARVLSHED